MSMMARLLQEFVPERWRVLPCLSDLGPGSRRHVPTGEYRLMENIASDGNNLWVERGKGPLRSMQGLADDRNKEGYITPASKQDATDRAAHRVMDKWNSTLELAKCTIAKKVTP